MGFSADLAWPKAITQLVTALARLHSAMVSYLFKRPTDGRSFMCRLALITSSRLGCPLCPLADKSTIYTDLFRWRTSNSFQPRTLLFRSVPSVGKHDQCVSK